MGRLRDYTDPDPEHWAKEIDFNAGITACFKCGKPIEHIEDCIFWSGCAPDAVFTGSSVKTRKYVVYLHLDCARVLATRLLMDYDGISERFMSLYKEQRIKG